MGQPCCSSAPVLSEPLISFSHISLCCHPPTPSLKHTHSQHDERLGFVVCMHLLKMERAVGVMWKMLELTMGGLKH